MTSSDLLQGKTVLVTGAALRLGSAIASGCATRRMRLVLHYRQSEDKARHFAEALRSEGGHVCLVQGDFTHPASAREVFEKARDAVGPIDFIVNNASVFRESTLKDFDFDALQKDVAVNAYAPLELCRALADQQRAGAVVNILDTRICDYDALHVAYHLSKRMLFSLTKMAALEFAPMLRVNAVAPGLILPPAGEDQAYVERLARQIPLQSQGEPEHVRDAVLFLLENPFITGQVIYVDGGQHMKGAVYG